MSNKVVLIAECCQNHNGNQEILKRMINEAAENGADYVKIQSIRSKEVSFRKEFEEGEYDKDGKMINIKRPYQAEVDRLSKLDLTPEQERWFVEECVKAGVAPLTTVFTRSAIKDTKDLGFEAVKIASYDCASFPLLRDVAKEWKTIFLSTGATYDDEIAKAADILKNNDLYLFHCITIYPTPLSELNMNRLLFLRKYSAKIGYSDHSEPAVTGLTACKIAIAMGVNSIERHFTILERDQTRDGKVSITPQELKQLREFSSLDRREMVEMLNKETPEWTNYLGSLTRDLSDAEILNRNYYRGRFASVVNGEYIYNWEEKELS